MDEVVVYYGADGAPRTVIDLATLEVKIGGEVVGRVERVDHGLKRPLWAAYLGHLQVRYVSRRRDGLYTGRGEAARAVHLAWADTQVTARYVRRLEGQEKGRG